VSSFSGKVGWYKIEDRQSLFLRLVRHVPSQALKLKSSADTYSLAVVPGVGHVSPDEGIESSGKLFFLGSGFVLGNTSTGQHSTGETYPHKVHFS
jgi:hypothetical protein